MRVVLVTLYDQCANGARSIAASARQAGHDANLVCFKRFVPLPVDRSDSDTIKRVLESGHMPCVGVQPLHDVICPFPSPVTEDETEFFLDHVRRLSPDVIGFSVNSVHLPLARRLTALTRDRFPGTVVVWGGVHPTLDPERSLEFVDAVCVGEGDASFVEFLNDPKRTDIAGFWFRQSDGGIIRNPNRPLLQAMDELPFSMFGEHEILIDDGREIGFDEISDREKTSFLIMSSHRGCPFSCTYCAHGNLRQRYPGQKYLRRRSVDKFLEELQLRVATVAMDALCLWDDIFAIGPSWIEEFCDKYPGKIGMPFGCYAHPHTSPRPMMEMLKKAGCAWLGLGPQSGSDYITLEVYDRKTTQEEYVAFGQMLAETGHDRLVYDILTNCRFQREADCRATVELLARMPKAVSITLMKITTYPMSRLATLDKPKIDLDPGVFRFYNMLYLLSAQRGFDHRALRGIAEDQSLRQRPEILEDWVAELARANTQRDALDLQNERLKGRIADLEQQIPWGVKRATSHLAEQVVNRVRKTLGAPSTHL